MDRTASAEHQPRRCFVRACTAEMLFSEPHVMLTVDFSIANLAIQGCSSAPSFDFWWMWMEVYWEHVQPICGGNHRREGQTTAVFQERRCFYYFYCSGLWVTFLTHSVGMLGQTLKNSHGHQTHSISLHAAMGGCQHMGPWLPWSLWLWSEPAADVPSLQCLQWEWDQIFFLLISQPKNLICSDLSTWRSPSSWVRVHPRPLHCRKYFNVPSSAKFIRSGVDALPLAWQFCFDSGWHLKDNCYTIGARRFGWQNAKMQVQMLTDHENTPAGANWILTDRCHVSLKMHFAR